MTLQDEIRRRREANLPPLTAEEQRQFQQNLTDTAAVDARMSEIGSTKTTMKGAKIVNGRYKGLTPPQAAQAAMTGAMPPGKFQPGAMGRMTGSLTGDSLYGPRRPVVPPVAQPAPTAAPAPAPAAAPTAAPAAGAGTRAVDPALIEPRGFSAGPSAAPRPQGLIMGQPAQQWLQEAANRQGMSNSYGTIKPQPAPAIAPTAPAPAMPSAAPRPIAPVLTEPRGFGAGPVTKPTAGVTPPATDKLTPLIQNTQALITKARAPAQDPVMDPNWRRAQIAAAQPANAAPLPPYSQTLASIAPKAAPPITPTAAAPMAAAPAPTAAPSPQDVMNPNWRRAQIAAAQPANAAPLPPYSQTLASIAPKAAPPITPTAAAPMAAAPAPTAAPSPQGLAAAQMGSFTQTLGKIGGALNANNPSAWINNPLGMAKKPTVPSLATPPQNSAPAMMGTRSMPEMGARPITAGASAPTARPAKTLQPRQLVNL